VRHQECVNRYPVVFYPGVPVDLLAQAQFPDPRQLAGALEIVGLENFVPGFFRVAEDYRSGLLP
jgi:hypothetical protein